MFFIVLVLILIIACIVSAVIWAHHSTKTSLKEATDKDVELLREAVEHSQRAANIENPILAITECTTALTLLKSLITRHGQSRLHDISGQNITELRETIQRQHDRIMEDTCHDHPAMVPAGELKTYRLDAASFDHNPYAHAIHRDDVHTTNNVIDFDDESE